MDPAQGVLMLIADATQTTTARLDPQVLKARRESEARAAVLEVQAALAVQAPTSTNLQ